MRLTLILSIVLMTGCASMTEEDRLFYMMHAVDVAQTYQISKSPCHFEGGLGTSHLIGEEPNAEGVIAWGIATAAFYHYMSDKLPRWAKQINISYRTYNINSNSQMGLGFSSFSCRANAVRVDRSLFVHDMVTEWQY